MPLVGQSPATIRDTAIYRQLVKTGAPDDGLLERVEVLVATASPLLDLVIAGPFRSYTLHNPDHAKRLVHLAGVLLEPDVLDNLSSLECTLIIYAAFIHDLGMSLTSVERQRLLNSPQFIDHLRSSARLWSRLENARSHLKLLPPDARESQKLALELEVFQLHEVALASYLRPNHATRATYQRLHETLRQASGRGDLFEYKGVSFEDVLVDICESHNLDVGVLAEVKGPYDSRFPRDALFAGQRVNSQFCAALLRLTDILDFDRERTPTVLFDNLGIQHSNLPGAEVSLMEWQKHMSVHTVDIGEHEVLFSGDSRHPAIEAAVHAFTHTIEREIRGTMSVLRNNPPQIVGTYRVAIPTSVRARIRPVGYVFHDIRMHLNESAVMSLLMGERLYDNSAAAVRELIQNAVDACHVRTRLAPVAYSPEVSLKLFAEGDGTMWLEVRDNGIGMDEHVITDYLFHIGSSYYDSPEFDRIVSHAAGAEFVPVSRFGIGLVSVFMIGDLLEITTANPMSSRGDHKERTIRVDGRGGLAFVTERASGQQGTVVRVRLKPEFTDERSINRMASFVREVVLRPQCPVAVNFGDNWFVARTGPFMSLQPEARLVAAKLNAEFVSIDLAKFSDSLSGVIVIPFAQNGGRLEIGDGTLVFDGNGGIDSRKILKDYRGNRVTVNGFRMGLKKANRIFGKRLRFAYDIEVKGSKDVVFDVARDRIMGDGIVVVRTMIREAVILGLTETGVIDRLSGAAHSYVTSNRMLWGNDADVVDDQTLDAVAKLIPSGLWPIGLHREIAKQLKISIGLARNAISLLLKMHRISDGRRYPQQNNG